MSASPESFSRTREKTVSGARAGAGCCARSVVTPPRPGSARSAGSPRSPRCRRRARSGAGRASSSRACPRSRGSGRAAPRPRATCGSALRRPAPAAPPSRPSSPRRCGRAGPSPPVRKQPSLVLGVEGAALARRGGAGRGLGARAARGGGLVGGEAGLLGLPPRALLGLAALLLLGLAQGALLGLAALLLLALAPGGF